MIILVEKKGAGLPKKEAVLGILKSELIKLGFKQGNASGSSIEYRLDLGKYHFFVSIPKDPVRTYYRAGYLVGRNGPGLNFETEDAAWKYVQTKLLPEIIRIQKLLHSTGKYWGVKSYGIDGAEDPEQYSIKDAMNDSDIILFNSRTEAATYADMINNMAGYYTGDPGQNYTKINQLQNQINLWLKSHPVIKV
jgi:hypothetical protein